MISVYRAFQLIMGIILSIFILYVLVTYAGSYSQVGEAGVRQKTLDVFLQDVDNVMLTGNSINFSAFGKGDYTSCHPRPTRPPKIWCFIDEKSIESESLLVPILTRIGNEVLITRESIDLGWTRLDYVLALDQVRVIFNPLDTSDETWSALRQAVAGFPDTSNQYPKVLFGFCDGQDLIFDTLDQTWERDYFSRILNQPRHDMSFSLCTADKPSRNVLVTVSGSCTQSLASSGICLKPILGSTGYAYITGSSKTYVYKDHADLAALIAGGDRKSVLGDFVGEEIWEFKNQYFLDFLETASESMERRIDFIVQSLAGDPDCSASYIDLRNSITSIKTLSTGDPYEMDEMTLLMTELSQASRIWKELEIMGCERIA
jgi:hypothetical protein